ncbi:MAG: type II toxin-antitoxin system HicB family antitoxin [Phycisphaerae bacterium]|nr:type II toxin-antitoxin system HicB family antitoxin [Phycisphaerae bacterium]
MKLSIRVVENQDGGYSAFCPSLPGCMSCGESRDEAIKNLDEAIRGYIAAINGFVPDKVLHEIVEV